MGRPHRVRDVPVRQIGAMREAFPQFTPSPSRGGIIWRGSLRPTIDSPVYNMVILHPFDRTPNVQVARPRIDPRAPHRYPDGSLCLYWPEEWRWSPKERLADSIVPWAALWLYYYEIWLITDQWLGPSSPHGADPTNEAA